MTGSKDKTLILWNLWKAATVKTLRGHTAGCLAVAITQDGRKVFSSGRDKFVRVWTVSTNLTIWHFLSALSPFFDYLVRPVIPCLNCFLETRTWNVNAH